MGDNRVVRHGPPQDENSLPGGHHLDQNRFNSSGKNFGNDYVNNITQYNGPKLDDFMSFVKFGNHNQEGVVKNSREMAISEKKLDSRNNFGARMVQ